jgi:hypothetical protein
MLSNPFSDSNFNDSKLSYDFHLCNIRETDRRDGASGSDRASPLLINTRDFRPVYEPLSSPLSRFQRLSHPRKASHSAMDISLDAKPLNRS